MNNRIGEFLWKLLLFSAACFLLHYTLQQYLAADFVFYLPLWQIYFFLGAITLLGYLMVLYIHRKDSGRTGWAFIAIGFLKMLAAVLFLYPMIAAEVSDLLVQVLAFFVPYFFFLGFDTFFTIRLISET